MSLLIIFNMQFYVYLHSKGAFILDTIMDFNSSDNSQHFPGDWRRLVPQVERELQILIVCGISVEARMLV